MSVKATCPESQPRVGVPSSRGGEGASLHTPRCANAPQGQHTHPTLGAEDTQDIAYDPKVLREVMDTVVVARPDSGLFEGRRHKPASPGGREPEKLHPGQFQLWDILEKAKPWEQNEGLKDQGSPGAGAVATA